MKKLLTLLSLILVISCAKDEPFITEVAIDVPENLKIEELVGIKTESIIVEEEVRMNVKLPYTGLYRIKLIDIEGTLISQEKIEVKAFENGYIDLDNVLFNGFIIKESVKVTPFEI